MSERLSGAGRPCASTPVLLRHVQRPFDDCDSLAGDFSAVVQLPSKSLGKAWSRYPERTYRTPQGNVCVPFCEWAKASSAQCKAAEDVKADAFVSNTVRDAVGAWRDSVIRFESGVRMFEAERRNTLLDASNNKPANTRHLRGFGMGAYRVQLDAIGALRQAASAADARGTQAGDAESRSEGEQIRQHLTKLCDATRKTTHISLGNRLAMLDRELAEVKVLNELTSVAQRERLKGGASVPLRLARRGDQYVLKPAKTHSVLDSKQRRARSEAASLALLLGLPASATVTLDTLRERGFGCPGNGFLSIDAPEYLGDGHGKQWVLARARDLMRQKDEGESLLNALDDRYDRHDVPDPVRLLPDDEQFEDEAVAAFGAWPERRQSTPELPTNDLRVRRWSTDGNDLPEADRYGMTTFGKGQTQVLKVEYGFEMEEPSGGESSSGIGSDNSSANTSDSISDERLAEPPSPRRKTPPAPPLRKSSLPPDDRFGHLVKGQLSTEQRETHEWISAWCEPLAAVWDSAQTRDEIVQTFESKFDPDSARADEIAARACRIATNLLQAKADPLNTTTGQRRVGFERTLDEIEPSYSPGKSVICAIAIRLEVLRDWAETIAAGPLQKRIKDVASAMVWSDFSEALFEELNRCQSGDDLAQCMLAAVQRVDPVDVAYKALVVPASKRGMNGGIRVAP